MFIGELIL